MSVSAVPAAEPQAVLVRRDVPTEQCEAYVRSHDGATAYHHPAWLGIIARAFRHRTMCLAAETADGIAGVLPLVFFRSAIFGRFAVSLPFVNYGGILADGPAVARALLGAAIDETRGVGGAHLELRHRERLFEELAPRRHKVAMVLRPEASVDAQWQALDKKIRNQVRKAEKSGLEAVEGGVELLDEFYAVFAHHMRDLGTPVYSRRWFAEVLAAFPDTARIHVVRHAGRPLAASVVHWYRGTTEVPWASALRESNPLCANVLLYWHMLRASIARGDRAFDFGRSTPGEGTFHFKKGWGAEPRELVWEYWSAGERPLPDMGPGNPKFSLAIRAWQRLPLPVANAVGPRIVRHIP